ncbi:hypothetical protein PRIPAC_89042 [Pristionchus pacificus]|uniref:Protein kinase domain-containing protein n=1 Tax=Pristionchus pacificus TaxID=54126 RepID=A0A454XXR4_PRIPA|nr:hypothetical protein PRIPAC_89042 [Pristionchus pacificus]|eukprot:PDM83147.1 protein kinase [Pristionchus pacificus]
MHNNRSRSPASLEEENRTLREALTRLSQEKTKCDEEISRLSSRITGFQLGSSWSTGNFRSKFGTEFDVSRILGIGGGGCVFEAKNLLDEWKYAVKRIAVDPNDAKIKKLLREVRAMAQLDHPNIIRYNSTWIEEPPEEWQYEADDEILAKINSKKRQLLDYNKNSVFIYIQMQLCHFSLAEWLAENVTPESRSLPRMKTWFKQMVQAVDYIHEKNLIHRDLKPANVLFAEKDRLKICDLGIVTEQKIDDGVEITMTRTGAGTEEYMSPEQRSYICRVNAKTDVFTLGLILAELCVVMEDYSKKVKIFDNFRSGKPTNIFTDERTAEFVGKLTTSDPKNRPTCKKLLDDLYLAL